MTHAGAARYSVTQTGGWQRWVTPRETRRRAIHRWYVFPHSFTDDLVYALIEEWGLEGSDRILDPFVGAGTTLVAAKRRRVPAHGCDLSPLAVFATNVKIALYLLPRLMMAWQQLRQDLGRISNDQNVGCYPKLVRDALPDGRLEAFDGIMGRIQTLKCTRLERQFFRLALVSLIPRFSHAVASGGWLRWEKKGLGAERLPQVFAERVSLMLGDLAQDVQPPAHNWHATRADARRLPVPEETFSAVVTSPPYPNRHDYTRVFGVELMFAFLSWQQNRTLRYQTFHSHPEARPNRPEADGYTMPGNLGDYVGAIDDVRIRRMLKGYFIDMYLCLREVIRVCRPGARIAFVVGNAQYSGEPLMVDELTAELGETVGLQCTEVRVVRWRGNSAQQMGRFGRRASRESIVMFEKRANVAFRFPQIDASHVHQ